MGVEPVKTIAPAAKDFAAIFNKVIESSEKAKHNMKLQADKHRNPTPDYTVSQQVWLSTDNLCMLNHTSKKLTERWIGVTTMSNSGPYPVTPVASQLYSSTPVAHHLLRSRSRRYTSAMYDPWSNPYTVLTTPRRLPWLDMSSPCAQYISYLVSFSPDLVYFTQT